MKTAFLIIVDTVDPDATARELNDTTVMTENGDEVHIRAAHTWSPPGGDDEEVGDLGPEWQHHNHTIYAPCLNGCPAYGTKR